jgi:Dolichyl-phosphate-mannose-protein mannosyltransferase
MSDASGSLSSPSSGICADGVDEKLRAFPAVFFLLICLADLGANLYGINFPTFWHPDELAKAVQLRTGVFNFHHPLLLLRLTWVADVFMPASGLRDVVLSGRVVSAAAVAVAVASCGTLVARRFGRAFGFAAAALVAVTPAVFTCAHFFKEDSVLLMGVALTMVAMQALNEAPTRGKIVALGLALGVVCSAKYPGAIMVIPAASLMIHKRVKLFDMALCLLCACSIFVAVDGAGIFGRSSLADGLIVEIKHVSSGHDGVVWGPLSPRTLILFWQSSSPVVIVTWSIGMLLFFLRPRAMAALILFVPLLWLAAAQLSMVAFTRYIVPATALASVAAVWTLAAYFEGSESRRVKIFVVLALLAGGGLMLGPLEATASAFVDNPRDRIASWIRQNLPSDAKIATEFYCSLPTPERVALDPAIQPLPQSILEPSFHLGSAGDLGSLRSKGITHIVISSSHFDRFFDRFATLATDVARQRRKFYQEVFTTLSPMHEDAQRFETDEVLSSRILVYDIRK